MWPVTRRRAVSTSARTRGMCRSTAAASRVYVSRFITPAQPGESTAVVQTSAGGVPTGGQVVVVDAASLVPQQTIVLRHSDKPDAENQGRGVPNYLGATALSPDGQSAWVPSKQDNIQRGMLRDGRGLDFQSTVRAIGSRIDLAGGTEDYAARLDFDNSGVASAAAVRPVGRVHVRRTGVEPPGRDRQRVRRLADLPHRRGSRAARPGAVGRRSDALRQQLHGSDRQRVRPHVAAGGRRDRRAAARDARGRRRREAERHRAEGQAALLRCEGHAARARCLHQLRVVPQRWRPRRPGLGPDRLRRGAAQHHRSARSRRHGAGLPALEQQLRRGAGLRGPDPQSRRRQRADDRRAVQHRHAQPASRRLPRRA